MPETLKSPTTKEVLGLIAKEAWKGLTKKAVLPEDYARELSEEDRRRIEEVALSAQSMGFAKGLVGKGFEFGKKGLRIPWKLKKTDLRPEWDSFMKGVGGEETSKKLEWMSPDEYMKRVAEGYNRIMTDPFHRTSAKKEFGKVSQKLVETYKEAMLKKGTKFPTPGLEYRGGMLFQEGRHRAAAAKEAGLEKIPVWIFEELSRLKGGY